MSASIMPRIRRRISIIVVAVVVCIVINYFILRSDSLPRIMTTESGSVIAPEPGKDEKPKEAPKPPPEDPNKKLIAQIPMGYGTAARPGFSDGPKVHIADLPHELLPGNGDSKRLVIIGDVHGQLTALKSLLAKVNFDRNNGDHLILTGDLINKGPDSVGVVQYAMDLNASAVRGNHEDRVLLSHKEGQRNSDGKEGWLDTMLKNMKSTITGDDKAKVAARDDIAEPLTLARPGTESELSVAATFSDAQLAWLDSLPVILRTGPFPGAKSVPWNAGTVAIVHAGLVPGIPLDKQSPQTVMTMRMLAYPGEMVRKESVKKQLEANEKARKEALEKALPGQKIEQNKIEEKDITAEMDRLTKLGLDRMGDRRVLFPLETRDGQPWSEVWSRHQSLVKFEEDRTAVIYGHDAKSGLRVSPHVESEKLPEGITSPIPHTPAPSRYAFGLDSGCVYGYQLSALILEADSNGDIKHTINSVDCEKATKTEPKN